MYHIGEAEFDRVWLRVDVQAGSFQWRTRLRPSFLDRKQQHSGNDS